MDIAEISVPPLALLESDPLEKAVDVFCSKDFGQIPVVDSRGRLRGVVLRREVLERKDSPSTPLAELVRECDDVIDPATSIRKVQKKILGEGKKRLYICDGEGRLQGVITEGRLIKALSSESQRCSIVLASALNSIGEGVVIIDEESRIVFANAAYTRILGVPVESILRRRMSEIEPGAKILQVLKTGAEAVEEEVCVKSLDKRVVVNISPIRAEEKIVGAVSVFRDVTEARQLMNRLQKAELMAEYLKGELGRLGNPFEVIIGESPQIRKVLDLAARAAPTDATVLITGESGVGKELIARAIHYSSRRSKKPLVRVDCTSIPDSLVESELFGYEDGAFTGARKGGKPGKVEMADGGTLFLDEIGEMNLTMQAKVLRLLQEREFEKVGGTTTRKLDVRVIAATNKDLAEMVRKGAFREDLYYRLSVIPIVVPPLRERREDIQMLIDHFIVQVARAQGKTVRVSPRTLGILLSYDWPGNVRELRNVVEHCVVLTDDGCEMLPEHLPQHLRQAADSGVRARPVGDAPRHGQAHFPLNARIKTAERDAILEALRRCNGNKSRAMEMLGISRRTFYKKLRSHGIPSS